MALSIASRSPRPVWVGAALATLCCAVIVTVDVLVVEPQRVPILLATVAVAVIAATPPLINQFVRRPYRIDLDSAQDHLRETRLNLQEERSRLATLRELDAGLDHAPTESEALRVISNALHRLLTNRSAELHLIDAVDPLLRLVLTTGSNTAKPGATASPWDSLAARTNQTIVYETTDRLDACPHLTSRLREPCAAVALPLNATGRLLGALYIFDIEGTIFSTEEVAALEDIANVIATRLAILRSTKSSATPDAVDRLTGLPDRIALQERITRLLEKRQPFSIAVADIDRFRDLNDDHGREAGNDALRLVAKTVRNVLRPSDIVGRIGGDELLVIMPDTDPDNATRALERIREELALNQTISDIPQFTLSIGVIASTSGRNIEQLLNRVASALQYAKDHGGNRVILAQRAHKS